MHGTVSTARLRSNKRGPTYRTQKIEPQRVVFRQVAVLAFPIKTVAALGHLTGASRSTIHTWLSGEHQPPASALAVVMGELMRRLAGQ